MKKNEDQLIKEMAQLLREGATMLDKTCPKCGTLIYRLPNKKIICPSCNSEIIIQKESSKPQHQHKEVQNVSNIHNFSPLLENLFIKIDSLNHILQNETDIYQIEKIVNIIDKTVQLYEKINRLNTQMS